MADASSSDSTGTMVASGIVTGLAALSVGLRFYVRIRVKRVGLSWDDWWNLTRLVLTLLTGGL